MNAEFNCGGDDEKGRFTSGLGDMFCLKICSSVLKERNTCVNFR